MSSHIIVKNAEEHNLKGINTRIPRDSLVVVTGVSGSGKSSLAFDTIFQEGQRKYIESLSSYARQFIGQMKRPAVERISGISPTISIDQKTVNRNPRSTVGTVTGIYDFMRLLFARLGIPYCPGCGDLIQTQTVDQIASNLLEHYRGRQALIMAPIVQERKGEYRKEQKDLKEKGFLRARIDGDIVRLETPVELKRYEKHTIEAVVDRIAIEVANLPRIREDMEAAIGLTGDSVSVLILEKSPEEKPKGMSGSRKQGGDIHIVQSTALACARCNISLPEMEPRLFSFNNPQGACPSCQGLGYNQEFETGLIVPDVNLSVNERAIKCITENGNVMFSSYGLQELEILAQTYKFSLDVPWKSLSARAKKIILYGSEDELSFDLVRSRSWARVVRKEERRIRGVIEVMQRVYNRWHIPMMEKYMRRAVCSACNGQRLNAASLSVRFRDYNIVHYNGMSITAAKNVFDGLELAGRESVMGREIIKEIRARLKFLDDVGLGYLSLDRSSVSLSGGEAQRIRLASQVGAGLQGVLYVLDEPSIGLHSRDNARLLHTLRHLRDLGNSLIVVEHDEETMRASDHLMDIGPGAGREGGQLVVQGTFSQVKGHKHSLTGHYLSGKKTIPLPVQRRLPNGKSLIIEGAHANNLKNITVEIPLRLFVCITGVSGSGKSTLVDFVLKRALAKHLYNNTNEPGAHKGIKGMAHIDRMVEIDQSPIGRTPRSNPATYTSIFDNIRDLFASLAESKIRGYKKGRFSFNVEGGRCEACSGAGVREIEMQLLANVTVPCEECGGRRFNDSTLEVHYKGKNIYHILDMSINEALEFFSAHPKIRRGLDMLASIGMGYVKLGQPSTTLSGGEAQRVKLATELQKPGTGNTFYILDEPTTGLHFQDIARLLVCIQTLAEKGNTVLVIEHNPDIIKCADYIIDMGPEGGEGGGRILAYGTPERIAGVKGSFTGEMLKPYLDKNYRAAQPPKREKVVKQTSRDIIVKGACKHNLKNISVTIPHHKLTVITGVSGSGKSSLAFDTLFAEGQRRFIESLSTYARRFLGRLDKGEVDSIGGLAPAIAIDQKTSSRSPKSTVATITEIYDYFRLLYSRLGEAHCPQCGTKMLPWSIQEMTKVIDTSYGGQSLQILAPLYLDDVDYSLCLDSPDHLLRLVSQFKDQGFRRFWIDNKEYRVDSLPELKGCRRIYLYLDRVEIKPSNKGRLSEGLETALEKGNGIAVVQSLKGKSEYFSTSPFCPRGHFFLKENIEPRNFSFNSHWGACESCEGLGYTQTISSDKLIPDEKSPLLRGGIKGLVGSRLTRLNGYYYSILEALLKHWGKSTLSAFADLTADQKKHLLHGSHLRLDVKRKRAKYTAELNVRWKGLLTYAEKWYNKGYNKKWDEERDHMMAIGPCPVCGGTRLKAPFNLVTVAENNIGQISRLTVSQAINFFRRIKFSQIQKPIASPIMGEILGRLDFLQSVGLGYLGLDRVGNSLSGGEAQRIRLASQIGSGLEGVLYVLDEPTVGLHQQDTRQLVSTLKTLRDLGNTVVVVEHDPEMINSADWVIDMGPGAGENGGEVVAVGNPVRIKKQKDSLTAMYLSGKIKMEQFPDTPSVNGAAVNLKGACVHNLKNVNIDIPLKRLVAFCGVSGSGKSSLIMDVFEEAVRARLQGKLHPRGLCQSLKWPGDIDDLVVVDQSPLGASPRSCPITYGKVFDKVRNLFAATPDAKVRGFTMSRFSMNSGNGRCPACAGMGAVKMEMHFLSDVWVTCDACKGRRYNADTLNVYFKGKNIFDVLNMTVAAACEYFSAHVAILRYLNTLNEVGLGYIRLGQSSNTLSGGEAQRVKLAAELARSTKSHNIYILDEPTTGLHMADIHMLQKVLRRLVEKGHSVLVIEHQLNVIAGADWVVELGPEGGEAGGRIIYQGTPKKLMEKGTTPTATSLRGLRPQGQAGFPDIT